MSAPIQGVISQVDAVYDFLADLPGALLPLLFFSSVSSGLMWYISACLHLLHTRGSSAALSTPTPHPVPALLPVPVPIGDPNTTLPDPAVTDDRAPSTCNLDVIDPPDDVGDAAVDGDAAWPSPVVGTTASVIWASVT